MITICGKCGREIRGWGEGPVNALRTHWWQYHGGVPKPRTYHASHLRY